MLDMEFDVETSGASIPLPVIPPLLTREFSLNNNNGENVGASKTIKTVIEAVNTKVPPLDLALAENGGKDSLRLSTPSCSSGTVYRSLAHKNAVKMVSFCSASNSIS